MKSSQRIYKLIKFKYKNLKISQETLLFEDLNLDSLELVNLISYIEKKEKKNFYFKKFKSHYNLKLKDFIKLFRP
jgi:acyl carrier protein